MNVIKNKIDLLWFYMAELRVLVNCTITSQNLFVIGLKTGY